MHDDFRSELFLTYQGDTHLITNNTTITHKQPKQPFNGLN